MTAYEDISDRAAITLDFVKGQDARACEASATSALAALLARGGDPGIIARFEILIE